MVCDHDETAREPVDLSERAIDGGRECGVDFVGFIGLCNKLDIEGCDSRAAVARAECPRISSARIERPRSLFESRIEMQ